MWKRKEKWDTLDAVLDGSWTLITRGANRFNDPLHWPVLGTTGARGSSLRTVILRHFSQPERVLICYTDARATKVGDIINSDRVSWLFYHPKKRIQLRISGRATLHGDDGVAEKYWSETGVTNRINYATLEPPGASVDRPSSGLPDFLKNKVPTLIESEKGRDNFMAIVSQIDSLDWLLLDPLGNRRARFDWDGDEMSASWIVP